MKKILFLYFSLLILMTLFSYLFVDQNLIYFNNLYSGFYSTKRIQITLFYLLFIILLFVFYFPFLKKIKSKIIEIHTFKKIILVTIAILFFSYPAFLSFDIFNYIATSKVFFFYHENPYIIMPIEFIGDPLLLFMHAPNKIALYGPFWVGLTGIPYYLGFGNFIATLFSFKLLVILFYLSTVYLIWKHSKSLLITSVFAFNPLVIIETLISAHNDIVMAFLSLASILFLIKKRYVYSFIFLLFSILIKYASIFLVPVFIYVIYLKFREKEVNEEKIFLLSAISMFSIFLFSFLREEIYPWYAIWFLVFNSFISNQKYFYYFFLSFSFSLMLRYVPFMLLGTYFGPTPFIKFVLTFSFPVLTLFLVKFKSLWIEKTFS